MFPMSRIGYFQNEILKNTSVCVTYANAVTPVAARWQR